jgi:hypothetical protein
LNYIQYALAFLVRIFEGLDTYVCQRLALAVEHPAGDGTRRYDLENHIPEVLAGGERDG